MSDVLQELLQELGLPSIPSTPQGPPTICWQVEVPGERTPLSHHLGFCGQTPLAVPRHDGADIYLTIRDGFLVAYRARGEQIDLGWRRALPQGTFAPQTLARWQDLLLVAPQPESIQVSFPGLLLVDPKDGATVRSIPVTRASLGPPAVDGDMAYSVAADGVLYAVDLARGETVWTLPDAGGFCPYPPLVVGRRLVLPANGPTLACVDLETRQVVWRFTAQKSRVDAPSHFLSTPVSDGRAVYAANNNGGLYAFHLESGEPLWPSPYFTENILDRSPVLAGELVLVAGRDHHVHAVERDTGALRWRSHDLGRRILSRPVVVGDVVFVGPLRRELYALRLEDGTPVWPDPIPLPDRVRGDLVRAGHLLVVPTRKGVLVGLDLGPLVQVVVPPDQLVAAGRWAEAVAALVQAEEWERAAYILQEHGLYYRAGQLLERAGRLREAAAAYAQGQDAVISLQRAAALYRQLGDWRQAATLLEMVEDWADAAQAWEAAGEPTRAARLYAERLGEHRRAAQLYAQAGLAEQAAALYQKVGDLRQAKRVLEEAGDPRFEDAILALTRRLIREGDRGALESLLARAHTPAERAELYAQAGEWTQAAAEWARAGEWRRAVEILVEHGHVEQALRLLQEQEAPEARRQAAHLLEQEERWQEALDLYQALEDLVGQARCFQALGNPMQAARLYEEAARRREAPRLSERDREEVAALFAAAAALYRRVDRRGYIRCRRKVHYYRRWPWLTARIVPQDKKKPFILEAPNLLHVELANEGAGPAYDVELELYNENGWISVSGLRPFGGIGSLVKEEQWITLVPHRVNDLTIRVRLRWTNPGGDRQEVELWEPWVVTVVDPNRPNPDAPKTVHVYGDWYQGSTVVHGNQYRDQAYHQEGDRVDIRRETRTPPLGLLCTSCNHRNPIDACFCENCGGRLEKK